MGGPQPGTATFRRLLIERIACGIREVLPGISDDRVMRVEGADTFEFGDRRISIRSSYSAGHSPPSLVLSFDPILCHATLIGLFDDTTGNITLPALLHFPDHGTFLITSPGNRVWPATMLSAARITSSA